MNTEYVVTFVMCSYREAGSSNEIDYQGTANKLSDELNQMQSNGWRYLSMIEVNRGYYVTYDRTT